MNMDKFNARHDRRHRAEPVEPSPDVLVFTGTFPALSETFVLDQIMALREAGFDVSIFAYGERAEGLRHPAVDDHRLVDKVTYLPRLPAYHGLANKVRFLSSVPPAAAWRLLVEMAAGAVGGVARHRSKMRRALNIWQCAAALHRRGRPNLAICHFGQQGDVMAAAARCLGWKFPITTVFHGNDMSELPKVRGQDMYDALFATGDRFLPVTQHWRDRLVAMGCPAERIDVFRMGVDVFSIRPRVVAQRGHSEFVLLSTGRLVEKKGHEFVIRALARQTAVGGVPQVRLMIAGDGPLRTELEALAVDLGVGERVAFLGSVVRDEVWRRLLDADAFVLASVTAANGDMEGLPVSLMEAMAAGVPVISTRHSGIPELIEDGVSGLLAGERDVDGLAECIARLIREPGLGERLALKGRAVVEEGFDLKSWNERLVQVAQALADNATPSPPHRTAISTAAAKVS